MVVWWFEGLNDTWQVSYGGIVVGAGRLGNSNGQLSGWKLRVAAVVVGRWNGVNPTASKVLKPDQVAARLLVACMRVRVGVRAGQEAA